MMSTCSGCARQLAEEPNALCPRVAHWQAWHEQRIKLVEQERDDLRAKCGESFDEQVRIGHQLHELRRAARSVAANLQANVPPEDKVVRDQIDHLYGLVGPQEDLVTIAQDAVKLATCPVCGKMAYHLLDGNRGCEHCTRDATVEELNLLVHQTERRLHELERAILRSTTNMYGMLPQGTFALRLQLDQLAAFVKSNHLALVAEQALDEAARDHGVWVRSLGSHTGGYWWWPDGARYEGTETDAKRIALGATWADRQGRVYEAKKFDGTEQVKP